MSKKEHRLNDEELSSLDKTQRSECKRLQKLLKSAISKGNQSEESKLCNTLGATLAEGGLLHLALRYHMQDLEISEKHGKALDIAVAHRKVGEVFSELGEFAPAIAHQEEYLQIAESISDLIEQQRAHATLGRTYYTQLMTMSESNEHIKDLRTKSGTHYKHALSLTSTIRDKKLLDEREIIEMRTRVYHNIGLLYDKVSTELSTQYLEKALAEACKIHDYTIQHLALLQLCECSMRDKDLAQALAYAERALKAAKSGENKTFTAECLELLGQIHLHTNNIVQARTNAKHALQINTDLENAMLVYKATKLMQSTQQLDFGQGEEELETLNKITSILLKLEVHSPCISWLNKELDLAKQCEQTSDVLADIHERLGQCYESCEDIKLATYHYTQQLSVNPTSKTWVSIARLSHLDNQDYESCFDSIQAAFGEVGCPEDKALCFNGLIHIAEHFDKDDVASAAQKELDTLELPESMSYSQSQVNEFSDIEISESETDDIDDEESERRPMRKRNKFGKVNEKGETILHQAAIMGNAKKVRELLSKHATPNTRDNAGWTPLHEACNHGYIEIVQMLVEAGADINDRGGRECKGITPLIDAAESSHTNIVRFLIEKGANVLAKDDDGRSSSSIVDTSIDEEPNDPNYENRIEIKALLDEAIKNPRKMQPTKRVDPTGLFTSDYSTPSQSVARSTQSLPTQHATSIPSHSEHYNRLKKQGVAKLSRDRSHVHSKGDKKSQESRLSAKSRKSSISKEDNWLVDDVRNHSPKRKLPQDPFSANVGDKKRLKQSKIPAHVIHDDESSPEISSDFKSGTISLKTTTHVTQSPQNSKQVLRVKVRIRKMLFLIPVKNSQSISDIAQMASERYQSTVGILPKLNLTTADGALLNSDDLALFLLKDGEELVGVISESQQDELLDKYLSTCTRMSIDPIFKDKISNNANSISISRALCSPKHLECLFTTALYCTTIVELDISYNKLPADMISTLTNTLITLTQLSSLNLSGCGLNKIMLEKILENVAVLPLEVVFLNFNALPGCLFPIISNLSKLKTLSVKNCCLKDDTILSDEISETFASSGIKTLDISQNSITRFPTFPGSLTSLTLGGSDIFKHDISLPASLEVLKLEKSGLCDNHLPQLTGLRNLTSFSAPYNKITNEGVVELLMLFPALTYLDLSCNPLDVTGIEELSLVAPPNLHVKVQNCCGSSVVCGDLINTLSLSLSYIDLSYNGINYPLISKHLSEETRSAVTCCGAKLEIKGLQL